MAAEAGKATSSGGITMPWPGLQALRQPAAIWRGMVRAEPFLAGFDEPRLSFSAHDLVQRIDGILQAIADRGGMTRANLSFEAAERLEEKLVDARWVVVANSAGREVPAPEADFAADAVVVCDACWRLTPLAMQRGFRGSDTWPRALCSIHSTALGASSAALRSARRRMTTIRMLDHPLVCRIDLPAPAPLATFTSLFISTAREDNSAMWSAFVDTHFPAVARAHPSARRSVSAAFESLDGGDHRESRLRLHEELICGFAPTRGVRRSEPREDGFPIIAATATRHSRGAMLLNVMMRTRELWLHIDEEIRHGGTRRGAGRPHRREGAARAFSAADADAAGAGGAA